MQRALTSIFLTTLPLATVGCLIPLSTNAQVTPDGTTSTTVNQDGNNFTIEQGDRVGDNLFHSFNEFSVPTLGSAVFNNATDIANIFSRVTGSSISSIDGLLGANGAANLYLINPSGIVFGQNASLNLGGSFFASTADSLLFEGDTEFSTVDPEAAPLLEVSIPIGARFRDNPGEIVNRSFVQNRVGEFVGLEVDSGKNLTLLGGDITLLGGEINFETRNLTARGGNIELGGLSEAGIVGIDSNGTLNYPNDLAKANINLFNGAIIDVASEEGGSINLNARDINLIGGSRIVGGIVATGVDIPNAEAGNININATNDVTLSGVNTATNLNSAIQNNVESEAVGNSGDVNIFARNLLVTNGAQIQTFVRRQNFRGQGLSAGNGNAGDINIDVLDSVTISGISDIVSLGGLETSVPSLLSSSLESGATGKAGAISITSDYLSLNDGGQIINSTSGIGNAGNITFEITNDFNLNGASQTIQLGTPVPASSTIFSNVGAEGEGNGGIINIQAGNLSVTNGAQIQTNVSQGFPEFGLAAGNGNAGNININVDEAVTISGVSEIFNLNGADNSLASLISSSLDIGATGKAGAVSITSDSLALNDGGQIISSTFGIGDAGNITLNTENDINLSGINSTVNINEGISGGIFSTVESGAEGNGGIIDIQAQNLFLKDGGRIETVVRQGFPEFGRTAGNGIAGDININVEEAVGISGVSKILNVNGLDNKSPSLILSALDRGATGQAGGISITSDSLSLNDGGQITASTAGIGDAGNINLDVSKNINLNGTTGFLARGNFFVASSAISSTVEPGGEGNGGVIDIQAENLSLTNGAQIRSDVVQANPQFGLAAGNGIAGDISINVDETVTISDVSQVFELNGIENSFPSLILSSLNFGATDEAGGISITSSSVELNSGGQIDVSSFGNGNGGDITIQANRATLNNGTVSATNTPSQLSDATPRIGGNVNFTIADNIVLSENSQISARASENATGGNVTINTDNGFILAVPNQDNDIIANADDGRGGAINIDTQAIFGLEVRTDNPITNDIDATSGVGGLDGTVDINNPAVDPTTGLIDLPASVGDASDRISQNPCQQGVGSQFIVSGKGGLPPSPTETLGSNEVEVGLVEPLLRQEDEGTRRQEEAKQTREDVVTESVPAMGWVFNDKGEVTLTAYSNTDTARKRSHFPKTTCNIKNPG